MLTRDTILDTLKKINEPELKHSIVKLGMIGDLELFDAEIRLVVKMPLPNSPSEGVLRQSIIDQLRSMPGVDGVDISFVTMNDEERLDLANRLHGRPSASEKGTGAGAKKRATSSVAQPIARNAEGAVSETDTQRKQVIDILSTINDPEINLPLTDLGMIKAFGINSGDVQIEILLTVPGCPLKDKIYNDVSAGLKKLDWVNEVGIEFGVMTEVQRQEVGKIIQSRSSPKPAAWEGHTADGHDHDHGHHGAKTATSHRHPVTTHTFAKRVIAVASGKGGVGKSTTTTNLAFALAAQGYKVGILDADVYGFSIPRMTGIHGRPRVTAEEKIEPVRKGNVQVMSMGYFVDEDAPVIWRGPLLHKAINQFLADVIWEKMDFLLIDLPPGTGDVTITISTALPQAEMLVVTTPQPVATHVAGRVAQLALRAKMTLLGVVENMSYFEVDGRKEYIFGKGGGEELAKELRTPLLGSIPLASDIRERADEGKPISAKRGHPIAEIYEGIATRLSKEIATPISR